MPVNLIFHLKWFLIYSSRSIEEICYYYHLAPKFYKRIIKDCFWDLNFKVDDIQKIISSKDIQKRSFLFNKILLNSTNMFQSLKIFTVDEIKYFLDELEIPKFNYDYIFKRKNMAEVYFLDRPLLIDELKWIA